MSVGYEFTVGWHKRHVRVWDSLLPRFNPTRFLEVGSYEGQSACYCIERFASRSAIELHCIDTWEGGVEHDKTAMGAVEQRFDANIARATRSVQHRVDLRKHKQPSHVALAELITFGQEGHFDVAYIDGSHQAPDVLTDAVLAFKLLRVDGLMIFDDYTWANEPHHLENPLNMPKPAIDAFLNLHQQKMQMIIEFPLMQVYAVKTAP